MTTIVKKCKLFILVLFSMSFIAAVEQPISPMNHDTLTNLTEDQQSEQSDNNTATTVTEIANQEIEVKSLLDGEVPLMLREFADIMRLYNTAPSNIQTKVKLFQRLLVRLNKMTVNTEFLMGQRDILKAVIRYKLGIKERAEKDLRTIIQQNPVQEIKLDAMYTLTSILVVNSNKEKFARFVKDYAHYFDPDTQGYIQVLNNMAHDNLLVIDAEYLFNQVVLSPVRTFQCGKLSSHVLNKIQDMLTHDHLNKGIAFALYNENKVLALHLMRIHVKKHELPYQELVNWERQIGKYTKDLYETVRLYQRKSDDYKRYVERYNNNINASVRGRIYHRRLYAYRGIGKTPYNATQTDKIFKEYVSGAIEERYAEENAQRAFRNFLSQQRYDLVAEYSAELRSKLDETFVSPYINFWESYALMQLGKTNDTIKLLGDIVAIEPESYYGIIAQKKLKHIFEQISHSARNHLTSMKNKSTNSSQNMLHYANTLYYLGNRIAKNHAEKILINNGFIFSDNQTRLHKDTEELIKLYLDLGYTDNARYFIYQQGIKTVYNQDSILAHIYNTIDNAESRLQDILAKRSAWMKRKNMYAINNDVLKLYYPTPYQDDMTYTLETGTNKMDPYLLYSIMRTESFYKQKARSRVGARGLMQIMPVTGKWLIDKYLPELTDYSLYDTKINIYLGSVYLYDNILSLGLLPALAAYNSGPTFVKGLIKKYNPLNDLELVEIHPKSETRNYVQKVIESYKKYSWIYNNRDIETIYRMVS